jgi:hypothetical protein
MPDSKDTALVDMYESMTPRRVLERRDTGRERRGTVRKIATRAVAREDPRERSLKMTLAMLLLMTFYRYGESAGAVLSRARMFLTLTKDM